MAVLVTLRGPDTGRQFPLSQERTVLGRNHDCPVCLLGKQVSRQHARILCQDDVFSLEDLGSSNGTYLNGQRLEPHAPVVVGEHDTFQIGPYLFAVQPSAVVAPALEASEPSLVIRETVNATSLHEALFIQDPAMKLQVVLEIAKQLSRTLDLEPMLDKLLEQLMKLVPQADRVLVILCEQEKLIVRAQRARRGQNLSSLPFSRTIVKRALDEGIGLLSEDLQTDKRFKTSHTITSLDLHSVICVPLINQDGKRLGVIQVDRFGKGFGFRLEDLHLLTAIGMQVSVVLENVALHAEQMREQRLLQELAMAHEIQAGFLPDEFDSPDVDFEIHGSVFPARQVAGDFYDFFKIPSGQFAFFIGDVSGKGMPAALFMIAVRTLCRHVAKEVDHPALLLSKLNDALADDNPSCMFVTLAHGQYEPATGEVVLASGGHPPPVLRRADGTTAVVALKPGRLLGYAAGNLQFPEVRLTLQPGDTLFYYTDGLLEARAKEDRTMFGTDRICALVKDFVPARRLSECADAAKVAIDLFTGTNELQDDLTLLLLRRRPV
jgi:serine phosphatase RsbU (regulator of sigma subunit)/pSer/pThr/pTyr-binding forkhead associated (FHA) protein